MARNRIQDTSFPPDAVEAVRWAYVQDIDDAGGGGFQSGEYVLLSDGRLFRRAAWSSFSGGCTSWSASPWEFDAQWGSADEIVQLFDHLRSRAYDLYAESPVPLHASRAGPFPGDPSRAMALERLDVTGFDVDLYGRALRFAAKLHAAQKVPGTNLPYLVHVVRVATEVLAATEEEYRAFRNLAMTCALLHDTIEDSEPADRPTVRKAILAEFGVEVLAGVDALTKNDALPKPKRMCDSLRRIREQPRAVGIVKLCDRLTNLDPPPATWDAEKARAYAVEARTILEQLGGANSRLKQRFERKLRDYEALLESIATSTRGVNG